MLIALLQRRTFRSYPWFTAYILSALLQSAGMFLLYRTSGLKARMVWNIAWGAQAVITGMRSLAVVEVIRTVFSHYDGIWSFTRRVLLWVGLGVLVYTLAFSHGSSQWIILNFIRGLELAMAAVVVTMLLFARYYLLPLAPVPRTLAVGLCLYSGFYVINYSVLERSLQQYAAFWNFLGMVTYVASLLVWLHGLSRYSVEELPLQPAKISPEAYGKLSSELNLRLYLLNRQLTLLLHPGERRP